MSAENSRDDQTPADKHESASESAALSKAECPPVLPHEGRHVLHGFYRIDWGAWRGLKKSRKQAVRSLFMETVQQAQEVPGGQLVLLSVSHNKADWGFIFLADDLHDVDRFAKKLPAAFGPGVCQQVFGWLSMTERSDYTTSEEEYAEELKKDGIAPDSEEGRLKIEAFRQRMAKYTRDRLYPNLPSWPVVCFYPMSKRRQPQQNWYGLPFETRKELMKGHARVGRGYAGRVLQLVTGSTGLDDMEWGVTLFAHTLSDIKAIVYEMRFDPVSAHYAEFGPFFIGLRMSAAELLRRLGV